MVDLLKYSQMHIKLLMEYADKYDKTEFIEKLQELWSYIDQEGFQRPIISYKLTASAEVTKNDQSVADTTTEL